MTRGADAIVARARALIGTRFRVHGRTPGHGLDCIGVAVMATGMEPGRVRSDDGLRTSNPEEANADFDESGFVRMPLAMRTIGDLLLVRAGPHQLHVVILTDKGYLHADARLRRVVEVPGKVPWPVLSVWRHPDMFDPESRSLSGSC
jgi:hypothetical protein